MGAENAILIELEDWEQAASTELDNEVMLPSSNADLVLHPSVRVGHYAAYMKCVNPALFDGKGNALPIKLAACTYLYQYSAAKRDALYAKKFEASLAAFPLFTKADHKPFAAYLQKRLAGGTARTAANRIHHSPSAPNFRLMDRISGTITGKTEYILLDEQQVIFDQIIHSIHESLRCVDKRCIIVEGGPGTGKSVLALNILAHLLHKHINAHYATGSKAFTTTLRTVMGSGSSERLRYFNSYQGAAPDSVDVILCDEAHRLRESSADRWHRKTDTPQIEELFRTARVCVFFVDDKQIVRRGEVGTAEYVRAAATKLGINILACRLETQFRCRGSAGFLEWLDNILGLEKNDKFLWNSDAEAFDFQIMDTPEALEAALRTKLKAGGTARMTAGYCWPWSKELIRGKLPKDVVIGNYQRPWNARPGLKGLPKGIPDSTLWAYESGGFEQIGCIYSAQGFEFDYMGVIMGRDIAYSIDEGTWVAHPENCCDRLIKHAPNYLQLIKNTYRVLLSRGILGCYVYFTDAETKAFFQSRMMCENGEA